MTVGSIVTQPSQAHSEYGVRLRARAARRIFGARCRVRGLVVARGHAVTMPKDTAEIGAIIEAGGRGRVFYGYLGTRQKFACPLKAVSKEIKSERRAMLFLEVRLKWDGLM